MEKKWILTFIIIFGIIIGLGIGIGAIFLLNRQETTPINYEYDIQNAFPNITFTRPLGIYDSEDGTNNLFVVEQGGRILLVDNNESTINYEIFLDIGDKIYFEGERGLLGFALHPDYAVNGYVYVYYSEIGTGDSVLSRFKVNSTNSNKANKSSEIILLKISQPYSNHNGGQLSFGPDDFLYIALGDGGGSGDPLKNGQNRQTMLGTILRIDIDTGSPYTIPNDNPFFGNLNGWVDEIYAFGFRNPWRFSFDPITGFLWVADVGQGAWEEIDIVGNISRYVKNQASDNFSVFVQNADELLLNSTYLEYIDGIGREDLFFFDNIPISDNWQSQGIFNLNIAIDNYKIVLVTDYPQSSSLKYEFYGKCIDNGFLGYVADQELDSLKEYDLYPPT